MVVRLACLNSISSTHLRFILSLKQTNGPGVTPADTAVTLSTDLNSLRLEPTLLPNSIMTACQHDPQSINTANQQGVCRTATESHSIFSSLSRFVDWQTGTSAVEVQQIHWQFQPATKEWIYSGLCIIYTWTYLLIYFRYTLLREQGQVAGACANISTEVSCFSCCWIFLHHWRHLSFCSLQRFFSLCRLAAVLYGPRDWFKDPASCWAFCYSVQKKVLKIHGVFSLDDSKMLIQSSSSVRQGLSALLTP